jgi:predicted nucleotidyltransferase
MKKNNTSLEKKYAAALAEFVKSESKKRNVLGIFVTGSFVNNNIKNNSDIDVFIIHSQKYSITKAQYLGGIEFECAYKHYDQFKKDLKQRDAINITRYSQAESLYDPHGKVTEIISLSKEIFLKGPREKITSADKYHLKDIIADIEDNLDNPAVILTIMKGFTLLVHMFYKKKNIWGVDDKNIREYLHQHDSKMLHLVESFFNSKTNKSRFASLQSIQEYVLSGVKPLPKMWKTTKKYL